MEKEKQRQAGERSEALRGGRRAEVRDEPREGWKGNRHNVTRALFPSCPRGPRALLLPEVYAGLCKMSSVTRRHGAAGVTPATGRPFTHVARVPVKSLAQSHRSLAHPGRVCSHVRVPTRTPLPVHLSVRLPGNFCCGNEPPSRCRRKL